MKAALIYGGSIHTMASVGVVEAMLIINEKVEAVGSLAEMRARAPVGTEEVNLRGRTVFPGFHDCHIHFRMYSVGRSRIDLHGVETLEEGLAQIKTYVDKMKPGAWVLGGNWDKSLWQEFPHRRDLDSVTEGHPALLSSKDGHSVWANSLALELARVTTETSVPDGGAILRDKHGELTGILQDAASRLVRRAIPKESIEEATEACADAIRHLWSMGLTGAHVPDGIDFLTIAQKLRSDYHLPFRFAVMPPASSLDDVANSRLQQGFGDDCIWLGPVKAFKDGALGSSTALLYEPYEHLPGYFGLEVTNDKDMREIVLKSIQAGFATGIHAIGDKAVCDTLDAIEAGMAETGNTTLRHRIEHAQMVAEKDIARFAQLGVIASVQPAHVVADRYMAEREWGARARWAYPFESLRKPGAILAFGSDAPVETPDPIFGIFCAVTRKLPGEDQAKEWYPVEKVSVQEAIAAYTCNAAYAAGREHVLGDLSPGKLADFVVLSQDLTAIGVDEIMNTKVEAVCVGGEFVIPPTWYM